MVPGVVIEVTLRTIVKRSMESLRPPEGLKLTGNVDCNWRTFKQQFELYISAIGLENKPDERKIALLLTIAGPNAIEMFNTFMFDQPDDDKKLEEVIKKFDAHCSPKKNETYERYVFRSRTQQQHETFDSFLTDLKLKAQTCNFSDLKSSMIRDQIVFGIYDKKVRERLLRETELKLEDAVKICHANELAQKHAKTFSDVNNGATVIGDSAEIGAVSFKGKKNVQFKNAKKSQDGTFSCKRCGYQHQPSHCSAFGKMCTKCNGKNHFAKQCFSKGKSCKSQSVHVIEDTDLDETFFVGMVSCDYTSEKATENVKPTVMSNADYEVNLVKEDKWIVPLQINGALVALKLDTGAKANLISISDIKAMKEKPIVQKKTIPLKDYNGQEIDCFGVCRLKVTLRSKVHHILFSVVAEGHDSLLGDRACEDLGLVKRVYRINCDSVAKNTPHDSVDLIVHSFPDIFKGFGVLPFTYKI